MSERVLTQPDYLTLSPDLEQRLIGLPESLVAEYTRELLGHTLKGIFNPELRHMGAFTGATPDAISQVQNGLLNSLEDVAKYGRNDSTPRHIIFPIGEYFKHPDSSIVQAMQSRTDHLKSLFLLDELDIALQGAEGGGRFISSAFEIEHPEFSWVEVSADNHTHHGISYDFYKEKPVADKKSFADQNFRVHLSYMGQREVPALLSEEYPYFAGMSISSNSVNEESRYDEETSFEVPEDIEELLSDVTNRLVLEELSKQYEQHLEIEGQPMDRRVRRSEMGKILSIFAVYGHQRTEEIGRILSTHGVLVDSEAPDSTRVKKA
jgi:hypothetical protein